MSLPYIHLLVVRRPLAQEGVDLVDEDDRGLELAGLQMGCTQEQRRDDARARRGMLVEAWDCWG